MSNKLNPTNAPKGRINRDVSLPVTPTGKSHLSNKQDGTKGNNISHTDVEKDYAKQKAAEIIKNSGG